MSFSISRIQVPPPITETAKPASQRGAKDEFAATLENAIQHVEQTRTHANQSIQQMLSGEKDELHNTILATQKAELEFEMFLQVRNKVVNAYQEIMKMQV